MEYTILIWQIENIIVLLVVDYADICLLRHLYKAIYKNIENEIFRYKKIQAICKFLIEHIAIWTLILGLVFSSIITVSATGKIFMLKNQQSSGKEETSNVSKEEKEEKVKSSQKCKGIFLDGRQVHSGSRALL